jgi:predicted nucleic acid-binding protein
VITYFDSSSIVKLFIDEQYSDIARLAKEDTDIVFTSILSYPEVLPAFNRACQEGRYKKTDMKKARAEFQREWNNFRLIKVDETLINSTMELIFKHNLRGADAVHLASALVIQNEGELSDLFFSCFDRNLNKAAKKEGLLIHEFG